MEVIEFLHNQTFLAIVAVIGTLITVISLIISFILARRSSFKVEPVLCFYHTNEISKLSSYNQNISILYQGLEVTEVTSTLIRFWNKGKRPLKKDDIPLNDTLKFSFTNDNPSINSQIKILDSKILKVSKKSSNIKISRNNVVNLLDFTFDFIDYQEGIVLEVQHTGDINTNVNLVGTILGPKSKLKMNVF